MTGMEVLMRSSTIGMICACLLGGAAFAETGVGPSQRDRARKPPATTVTRPQETGAHDDAPNQRAAPSAKSAGKAPKGGGKVKYDDSKMNPASPDHDSDARDRWLAQEKKA